MSTRCVLRIIICPAQIRSVTGVLVENTLEILHVDTNGNVCLPVRSREAAHAPTPTDLSVPAPPRIRQLDSSANVPRRYFVEESICWPKLSNFALFCP